MYFWGILWLSIGFVAGWARLPAYLKANLTILTNAEFLSCLMEKNDLKTVRIDIKFSNFQKIKAKRNQALKYGRLESSDDDFVNANISSASASYKCKIRLKGDLADHWSGNKWSLRVEMKDGGLIHGMSKFSLQDPATRMDTFEWLFLKTLELEGLMAVRYDFVNLVINGKAMGIYAIEEHFSKEFIESNQKREGLIVTFDDYLIWKTQPPESLQNIILDSTYRSSPPRARNFSRNSKNPNMVQQKETAFGLLRCLQEESLKASEIFSSDKLGKFLAITHLWNTEHGLGIDDINFFFDPVTCRLEPIGFDGEVGLYPHYCFFTAGDMQESWVNFVLKDPLIASSYIKNLTNFTRKNYVSSLKKSLEVKEIHMRRLILSEFLGKDDISIWKNINKIHHYDPWKYLEEKSQKISNELLLKTPVVGFAVPDFQNNRFLLSLKIPLLNQLKFIALFLIIQLGIP